MASALLPELLKASRESGWCFIARPDPPTLLSSPKCLYLLSGEMVDVVYVMAYEGGEVVPSDGMRGAQVRWATMEEVDEQQLTANAPGELWLLQRALQVWRLWRDGDTDVDLEPYAVGGR